MRVLLACCLVATLAAEDAWVSWWRRAEADTVRADRGAALAARRADPPPAAAGGLALAHHRLLLAWLGGDAAAAGHLAALRTQAGAVVHLLDPAIACPPLEGATPAEPAVFSAAVAAGAPADASAIAGNLTGKRGFEAGAGVLDGLTFLRRRDLLWALQPEEARRRTGLERAPVPLPRLEAECLLAAADAVQDADNCLRPYHVPTAAAWAFLYRVGVACPDPYRRLAWWISLRTPLDKTANVAAVAIARQAAEVAARQPALLQLALPALTAWGERRRTARRFGMTTEADALVAIVRLHLERPAEAAAADQAYLAAADRFLAESAWPPPAPESAEDEEYYGGPPLSNRRGSLVKALGDWQTLCDVVTGWSGANVAGGRRLEAWDDAAAARAAEGLRALRPVLTSALDSGFHTDASEPCTTAAKEILAAAGEAIAAQRAVLAAQAAGETRVLAAMRRRDDALRTITARARTLAAAEADMALIYGAAVATFPASLGLGEVIVPVRGRSDGAEAADAALQGALRAPWDALARRLVALRREAAIDPGQAWNTLRRQHDTYAALAAARHPDLDLIATDLAREGAEASAVVLAAARAGSGIPAEVDAAVRAWIAATARPSTGRQQPPDRSPTVKQLGERFLVSCADLGSQWSVLGAALFEASDPAARLAEQDALLAITAPDPGTAALMRAAADLLGNEVHLVAEAHLRLAADPDPAAHRRYVAAARAWIAAMQAEAKP